ncbi:MAG: GNAT family N-acetyltransferase [Clostridiales bacterium]|nr:GNAT family N-acetyltransferase [Clostridiales bacterium]
MEIIEIGKYNAGLLFDYWNKIGKDIPYFYKTSYQLFKKSLFDDTFEGMPIFSENKVFVAIEKGSVKGFIQYGLPTFHFTESGKITQDINIGVIRNLYYERTITDIGRELLDLSLMFFEENNIKEIYAFYHAMGMSCNGNHGKLHEKFSYIDKFLQERGFEIEHQNVYYICDMKKKRLELSNYNRIDISQLYDNRQKFILYDTDNNVLGSAEIKYIGNLTDSAEDIIYLVWIGIDKRVKGRGMGTQFLNHIIQYCLTKGYRYLHTDTALENINAQKFYIRNGFIDKGVTRSYLLKH